MAGTITHSFNGTILTITSDSGTTAMDLKGEKGDTGARGARGLPGKAGGGARIEDGVISDETTWSSSGIIDRFAELMGTNANPAVLDNPYPNYPLQITTTFEAKQSGSGEPSPTNIRPISGFNSAKLTRCGINLADFAFVGNTLNNNGMSGTFDNNGLVISGTPAQDYAHILATDNIKLQNGTYFVSGGDLTKVYLQVGIKDASGNTTLYANEKFTIKGNEQAISFTIQAGLKSNVGTLSNYRLQPMIICGSSAPTAYEPYQGDTYTTDFGQTVYGGTLDWNTGVLTVDRAFYTFDGSEGLTSGGWNNPYSYVLWGFLPDVVNYGMSDIADAYCSHYIVRSVTNVITNAIAGFAIYDSGHLIFSSPTHTTVDAFKSYLAAQYAAGTPVQVCYKLATPQTIQLTPQEIKAIKGINTLYSNAQELTVIGRVDTMYQLSKLAERVSALEAAIK